MSPNFFFVQLRREFKNDPYRDRFLAELQDHAEDLAESESIPSDSLNSTFMQKHFGEPKDIKKTFTQITRPWQKVMEAGEAMGYGFLGIGLSVFLPFSTLAIEEVRFSAEDGMGIERRIQWLVFLAMISSILALSFFLYRWIWSKLDLKNSLLGPIKGFFMASLPILIMGISFARMTVKFDYEAEQVIFFSAFVAVFFGALLAFLKPKNPSERGEAKSSFLARISSPLILLYISVFSVMRMADPTFHSLETNSLIRLLPHSDFWRALFMPVTWPEMFFFLSFFELTNWQPYLWIVLLAVFALFLLMFIVKKRFWLAGAMTMYLLGVFLSPAFLTWMPEFKVPAYDVSEALEKKQLGPFYRALRHLNEDIGPSFSYNAAFESEALWIEQSKWGGRVSTWRIPFNGDRKLEEGWLSLGQKINHPEPIHYSAFQVIPKELTCVPAAYLDGVEVESEPERFTPESGCKAILWKGREIYESEGNSLGADSVSVSKGEKWLLLKSVNSVYLLDLRSLS